MLGKADKRATSPKAGIHRSWQREKRQFHQARDYKYACACMCAHCVHTHSPEERYAYMAMRMLWCSSWQPAQ